MVPGALYVKLQPAGTPCPQYERIIAYLLVPLGVGGAIVGVYGAFAGTDSEFEGTGTLHLRPGNSSTYP